MGVRCEPVVAVVHPAVGAHPRGRASVPVAVVMVVVVVVVVAMVMVVMEMIVL